MNATFTNKSGTLQDLNEEAVVFKIPAIIILVLLMFFGVIGNGLVIYVYGCRLKKTSVQYFIALLAIFDLGSCSIGVPLDLTIRSLPYLFPTDELCKFAGFLIHFTTIASVFTLLVISMERYNKLCRTNKIVLSEKITRYIAVIISLLAALISSPSIIVSNRTPINVTDSEALGYACLQTPGRPLKYYHIFLLILTTSSIFIMLVLYVLVWKRLRRYYLHVQTKYTSPDTTNCLSALSTSAWRKLIQTTKITFIITVLFIVSFLPLTISQIISNVYPHENGSNDEKIYMPVLRSLWALNCSLNPFVYGFYCRDFKQEIIKTFQTRKSPTGDNSHV